MRHLMAIAAVCLCAVSARASSLADTLLSLQVSTVVTTSDGDTVFSVSFPDIFSALSRSTGPFTVGGYTISNITEEFVGSSLDNVDDPLQFRLTGIDSITCNPCGPLEIDFAAGAIPNTDSGFYQDLETVMTSIGMDGTLSSGNDLPVELIIQFADGSFFDNPTTLSNGQPFSQSMFFGPIAGVPTFVGSLFLGCGCTSLAPGQVFSAPDSISVTFLTPEPATWALVPTGLLGIFLTFRRGRR
jgi:hypothetical protein